MPKIKEVQEKIKNENLDSFFFSSQANVFYLTYFHSSNAFVILTPEKKFFITDSRYYEGAVEKLKEWEVILLGKGGKKGIEHLKEILNEFGGNKIGFEKDKTTISFYEKLTQDGLKDKLVGYEGFLDDIRISKTEEEIEIIKTAVKQIDNVFKKIINEIKQCKTELDVRRRIINHIFEEGGTGESFPAIVASGKNSAIPHYETSNNPIQWNNLLLIDMGSIYKGYCSDFTRTLILGKVDPELEKIYEIVKEAHLEATSIVKAGIPIKEIDLKAREIIKKYGYGEYYIHSTGHGIGVEIHESPRIYKDVNDTLKENTVFTIEPGIYLPKKGGVRLENIVVARENGVEVLTQTPLDKVVIE
jgi:Xaa-Pro aminopeptidase/Xaa-Pro dipeptidase